MKKALPKIAVILAVLALVGYGIWYVVNGIVTDGYVYIGGWMSIPEKALEKAAEDSAPEMRDRYTMDTHLDTVYIGDTAMVVYISVDDYFVVAECVSNSAGKWHYHGSMSNSDPGQIVGTHYTDEETGTVYGWKHADSPDITVNGQTASTKSYTFTLSGREYSVDYWWCDGVDVSESEPVVKNAE